MKDPQANNPLHGITLEMVVTRLVEHYGWEQLGGLIDIRCFNENPSISSSLKFLRKTPWARTKVENLYIRLQRRTAAAAERDARASQQPGTEGTHEQTSPPAE